MRKVVLASCLMLSLAVGLVLWTKATVQTTPKTPTIAAKQTVTTTTTAAQPPTRPELLALVNAERAKNGVAPLAEDPRLDQSAQMKADDLAQYGYFAHVSPPNSPYAGLHGYQLINKVGVTCINYAENLDEPVPFSAASTVLRWINSPEHHVIMLDSRYNLTGFGIVNGAVAEHFCQSS